MTLTLSDPDLLETGSYIEGQWVTDTARPLAVMNPATGECVAGGHHGSRWH